MKFLEKKIWCIKFFKEISFLYIKIATSLDFQNFCQDHSNLGVDDDGICVCNIRISIHSISFNTNANYLYIFCRTKRSKDEEETHATAAKTRRPDVAVVQTLG